VARAPDRSSAEQFSSASYMKSWWANNPYYASTAGQNYNFQAGNQYTDAAARSGVVNTGGYLNVSPEARGIPKNAYTRANPRNSSNVPYDYLGNVKKQKGDVNLGLVLMGGYQFPGQAFSPERDKTGRFGPNALTRWMIAQGAGGVSTNNLRYRQSAIDNRSTGWRGLLTQSPGPNKAIGGRGQSSQDSTREMYSTIETRLGTRAQFTDEAWQEEGAKYGRSWAGFKALPDTGGSPHLMAELGQMYKRTDPNVGFARRVQRNYF